MTPDANTYAAVILGAGMSERMGRPKPSLKLPCGRSFAEAIWSAFLGFGCREVVLVMNETGLVWLEQEAPPLPARVVTARNEHPEKGRFFSLQTGLHALKSGGQVFMHNADNPFVGTPVLQALAARAASTGFVCPSFDGQAGHPILLSPRVVADCLRAGPGRPDHIRKLLASHPKTMVAVDDVRILANINQPQDMGAWGLAKG